MKVIEIDELLDMLDGYKHKELHIHHTWKPSHKDFNGGNHIELQEAMRNYHVNVRGWSDIGQHVSIAPDGKVILGRSFDRSPASIKGYNSGGFCVEMIGDFDEGKDKLEGKQLESIVKLAKYFDDKGRYVRFHRENSTKSCPGSGVQKTWFMNQVRNYSPSPEWKLDGVRYLNEQGLLSDLEGWTNKIDQDMPVWAITLILKRIHQDLKGGK